MADNNHNNLNNLYNILGDLWGTSDSVSSLAEENARRLNEMTRELEEAGAIDPADVTEDVSEGMSPVLPMERRKKAGKTKTQKTAEEKPAEPEKEEPEKPSFPPFEVFWKLADENVDWTDALSYAQPQEEGIDPELWAFLHEHAAKVLDGDLSAYVEVLKKTNPLGNVRPYARGFAVHAENADRLTVSFEGLDEYLAGDETADRHYLAGISLRCARDLMAVLPVREVAVTAKVKGEEQLNVTFHKSEMLKVRFGFVDPVEFAEKCGGTFKQKAAENNQGAVPEEIGKEI